MPRLAGCPQDVGVSYGYLDPIAIVLHRTYGQWPGDYSVIKGNGLAHFLIGQQDGQWVQFVDTNQVTYHCNGANFKAVGIELTGTNDDPLTAWQEARLGDVLQFLHAAHGIPLDYTDPSSVAPASIWVNGGGFRGVISHDSVRTDDGTAQHSDLVTVPDYNAAVAPAPKPPEEFYDMVLYKTTDDGKDTYYRDAGGILVKLAPEEAAAYYTDIVAKKIGVISLGGVLGALAYNAHTKAALTLANA